jgi:hypothetical protein
VAYCSLVQLSSVCVVNSAVCHVSILLPNVVENVID